MLVERSWTARHTSLPASSFSVLESKSMDFTKRPALKRVRSMVLLPSAFVTVAGSDPSAVSLQYSP